MGKLSVFNFTTLNGNYKDRNGDIRWHKHGFKRGGELREHSLVWKEDLRINGKLLAHADGGTE
jgi:hypothetical protein